METAIINSEFITTVGLPGFICILTIICIGKTNLELKPNKSKTVTTNKNIKLKVLKTKLRNSNTKLTGGK